MLLKGSGGHSPHPRVLCVDDEPTLLTLRKEVLEKCGCDVVVAGDAVSCIRKLKANKIDLVILDYHLEDGVDGEQLARAIRSVRPNVPLVMLTADVEVPESTRRVVDRLLIKGWTRPTEMVETILELLPECEPGALHAPD